MLLHRRHILPSTILASALLVSACKESAPKEPVKPAPVAEQPKPAEQPKLAATSTKAAQPAAAAESVPGGSGVVGVVRFEGAVPPPRAIDMSKDPACVKMSPKASVQEVEVANGNLAGVFVYVKSGLPEGQTYPVRAEKVVLDQKGCLYHPSVLGLQVGQPLQVVNSDALLHNVHAFAKGSEFNQAMPKQHQTVEKKLKKQQVLVDVKCEVHPWMHAWVGVVDHPFFAVSDQSGAFTVKDLPAGEYTLEAVHEKLGTKTAKVTVTATGTAAPVEFTF